MTYCDFDPAEVYVATTPKAKKPHRCCECRGTIRVGETYERVFMVYCGDASTSKTCMDCVALWCDLRRSSGDPCGALHGGLIEALMDAPHEHQERLRAAFNVARDERRKASP